jgi:Mg/Co/Ni transporter MgtE
MPLYYFSLFNDDVTMDDEGVELADVDAARSHALKEARVMAANSVRHGHLITSHRIEVVDEDRRLVGTVRVDEAVDIRP